MFDFYGFSKSLKIALMQRIGEIQNDLETANIEEVLKLQGRILGLREALREVQDLLDQIPKEDD